MTDPNKLRPHALAHEVLQDAAMDYVTGRESLTVQDLWHWLARMTPDE